MRIVYVIEQLSRIGGIERIMIDKMNYLAEHTAHEIVLLLIWHDNNPLAYPLNPNVRIVRLNVPFIPKLLTPKLLALYRFNKEIARLSPDITIYVWTMGAFLAAYTNWRGKSIYESHLARHTMRNKWVLNNMEKKVDAVVTLTKGDAQEFHTARKVFVIPNMTMVSTEENPHYESCRCIVLGRLVYQKNIHRLLGIWRSIGNHYPDWHLDIVGDGPDKEDILRCVKDYSLSGAVTIHSSVNDVVSPLLERSILLMTSRYEGLPMSLIEAQTCGLPCIAFDCPYGPADIIEDGKTGFLIPYDDDDAFLAKLSALMDDEALRRKMGEAAKEASRRYQPAPVMSQWLKLFNSL